MSLKFTTELKLVCERCKNDLQAVEKMNPRHMIVWEVELCTCLIDDWKQSRMEEEEGECN